MRLKLLFDNYISYMLSLIQLEKTTSRKKVFKKKLKKLIDFKEVI